MSGVVTLTFARKELRRAQDALSVLGTARDVNSLEASWVNVLRYLERFWNKANAEMKRHPKWQGWPERGHIERERKKDPLLSYVHNARGAEEHGIAEIADKKLGSLGINPAFGNSLYIEKLTIRQGQISELQSPQPIRIDVTPATFTLRPVENRGAIYPVPSTHAGKALAGVDPLSIATAAVTYYANVLSRIESAFRE